MSLQNTEDMVDKYFAEWINEMVEMSLSSVINEPPLGAKHGTRCKYLICGILNAVFLANNSFLIYSLAAICWVP